MRTSKPILLLLAVFALFAAACGNDSDDAAPTTGDGDTSTTAPEGDAPIDGDGPTILIGAQDFGESAILAEIYAQVLEANGFDVDVVGVGGFRGVLLGAYESGDVNFSAEYAASMLEFLNEGAGEATGDADETVDLLQDYLDDLGLTALMPSPAVDTNAFVVTEETATELGLAALSDLTDDLSLGAPQDCETNPFCLPGLTRVYGVDLTGGFVPLEANLVADALGADEVQVGVLFSTSGRIADEGWVLLEDDLGMLAADNVTPVLSDALLEVYGDELSALVDEISAAIDTAGLTELNKRFDIDLEDASDIAADFIEAAGLL